jgi:hypothetical protein
MLTLQISTLTQPLILLNIITVSSSLSSCNILIFTIVALAAGDTTVLAATGMRIGPAGAEVGGKSRHETGWACMPRVDAYVRQGIKAFKQDIDVEVCSEGLIMDVLLLGEWSIKPLE